MPIGSLTGLPDSHRNVKEFVNFIDPGCSHTLVLIDVDPRSVVQYLGLLAVLVHFL